MRSCGRQVAGMIVGALACAAGAPGDAGAQALIVLDSDAASAVLVDPVTYQVIGQMPTGPNPHELAVSRDGRYAYVTSYADAMTPVVGDTLGSPWVTVLDLAARRVMHAYEAGSYGKLHGIWLGGQGRRLWATAEADSGVVELDALTGDVLMLWKTGGAKSHTVVTSPDNRRIYVANAASDSISIIDRQTVIARRLFTGRNPEGLALSPDGHELWVAHRGDHTIRILATRSLEEIATFPSGGRDPVRIAFSPNGSDVWVTHEESREVVVMDLASAGVLARISLDGEPRALAFSPDGARAFITAPDSRRVFSVNTSTWTVDGSFTLPGRPLGVAWSDWRAGGSVSSDR